MAFVKMNVSGLAELRTALGKLRTEVGGKIVRDAAKKGAEPILNAARENAKRPDGSGLLASTLKVRMRTSKKWGRTTASIQTDEGDYKGQAFYGAFVEYGHKLGKRPSAGKRKEGKDTRKEVPPKPFMRPAFDAKKDEALAAFTAEVKRGIEQAIK